MMMLFINTVGITLAGIIIWWYWFAGDKQTVKETKGNTRAEIRVKDGVYQPAVIQVLAGQPVTLRFIREDATPCAESVIFSSLNISRKLPLNDPIDVELNFSAPGRYEFTCQMGMYRGKIIVK